MSQKDYSRGYAAGRTKGKQDAIGHLAHDLKKAVREECNALAPHYTLEVVQCCVCKVQFGMTKGRAEVVCSNGHKLVFHDRVKKNRGG